MLFSEIHHAIVYYDLRTKTSCKFVVKNASQLAFMHLLEPLAASDHPIQAAQKQDKETLLAQLPLATW